MCLQNANVLPRSFNQRMVEGMQRARGGRLCRVISQNKINEDWIPIDDLVREIANMRKAAGALSHLPGNKGDRRIEENASGL